MAVGLLATVCHRPLNSKSCTVQASSNSTEQWGHTDLNAFLVKTLPKLIEQLCSVHGCCSDIHKLLQRSLCSILLENQHVCFYDFQAQWGPLVSLRTGR